MTFWSLFENVIQTQPKNEKLKYERADRAHQHQPHNLVSTLCLVDMTPTRYQPLCHCAFHNGIANIPERIFILENFSR